MTSSFPLWLNGRFIRAVFVALTCAIGVGLFAAAGTASATASQGSFASLDIHHADDGGVMGRDRRNVCVNGPSLDLDELSCDAHAAGAVMRVPDAVTAAAGFMCFEDADSGRIGQMRLERPPRG